MICRRTGVGCRVKRLLVPAARVPLIQFHYRPGYFILPGKGKTMEICFYFMSSNKKMTRKKIPPADPPVTKMRACTF